MGILGSLRPMHWIGLGLVAAAIATGAWTNVFGLLGGNESDAKKLNACLQHHHINPLNMAATMGMGDPAAMLGAVGGHDQQALRTAIKHGKIQGAEANSVMTCVRRVTR
jgi:hypothetical protein